MRVLPRPGALCQVYLATRKKVACTILHAPIMSGLRFLIPPGPGGCCSVQGCCSPVCVYGLCDPFPNIKRIRRVKAPVLLIHGTNDKTVPHSHSLALYKRIPQQHRRDSYIIEGAGHENVVEADVHGYFNAISQFLSTTGAQSTTHTTIGIESTPPVREYA